MARVVIVDDSRSSLALMERLVGTMGCEVVAFEQSAAGLTWCLENDADVVVVDYVMPPPDGLKVIEALRKTHRHADTPVVMVTTSDSRDVRYMALQMGATDFLAKPVDEVEFVARVRNLVRLSEHQKAIADRSKWLAGEVRKATRTLAEREREAVLFLGRAAEHRDPETGAHLVRMATYSKLVAEGVGMSADEAELVLAAAPLHDVGKIGIPDNILLKPGRLDPDEFETMKTHTTIGSKILEGSTSPLLRTAATIAACHHERFDGTGYPQRLKGGDIPLIGRVVALADVFDALTSRRPYKEEMSFEQALAIIVDGRGSHFDPACVDAFMASLDQVRWVHTRFRDTAADASMETLVAAWKAGATKLAG
jgi:putative two-component system response regulator